MKSFILRTFCVRIARAAVSAACFSLAPAKAEMRSPTFANPPQLQETTPAGGPRAETFAETLVKPQIAPRKTLDLRVKMVNSRIYNPLSDSVDTVSLRGYIGADVDPDPLCRANDRSCARPARLDHTAQ